jgi:hypothetical protein
LQADLILGARPQVVVTVERPQPAPFPLMLQESERFDRGTPGR